MPHYADGTEAKVGDHVIAPVFNTGHKVAGTIVSITPGTESCNAKIRFVEAAPALPFEEASHGVPGKPRMAIGEASLARGNSHGSSGPLIAVWVCEDYCDCNKLTKVV